MQKIFLLLLFSYAACSLQGQSLSGQITDSANQQALTGASIYIPQKKTGALTDKSGNYKISNLPNGTYQVEVRFVGYAPISKEIIVNGDVRQDFVLAAHYVPLKEVLITALGYATTLRRAPTPVTIVTHDMLLEQASTNVIDALATQPGISQITTGPGVSKPEINGLGYNRVLTLMDGERQEDFQWGDEHGILIDPYAVYSAEIIRGPASLQYGANAVGGVVSFKSQPLVESGTIQGSFQSQFQTNNGLIGNSFDIGGNKNGLFWETRASYEAAHCYWGPHDGYVWGTAYDQYNLRGTIGVIKSWGSSRLSVSMLHRQTEIPDGNRDSATRQFEFDVPIGAQYVNGVYVPGSGQIFPTLKNFLSYSPNISGYQVLYHETAWWQNSFNVASGSIGADIGYTQSIRHEIDTGTVGEENMIVHDIPYSFRYQFVDENSGLKFTTGINGVYEFENNYPEPLAPYIGDFEIPNYHIFDIGGYGILEKTYKDLTLSGGFRYDLREINGQSMYLANYDTQQQQIVPAGTPGAYTQFPAFSHSYTGFSGSIGGTYQMPGHTYVKLNVARSYRAPAINELTANELDPSNVYKLGDPNLKSEYGYEVDAAIGYNWKDLSFELDGFYNRINNFIFPIRIESASGGDSMQLGAPVYKYTATTAWLGGATASLTIHPTGLKWFEMDNGFTYIYSFFPGQSDSTQHIPFTPAPRLTSKIRVKINDKSNSIFSKTYVSFGLAKYWPQNNIYNALYNELPSVSYTLFDASIGTNFIDPKTRKVICTLLISSTNLFNIAYYDHTSRPLYFWAYNGVENPTNFGAAAAVVTNPSQGIWNMGRNISFKVIFPIGEHKVSETELRGIE